MKKKERTKESSLHLSIQCLGLCQNQTKLNGCQRMEKWVFIVKQDVDETHVVQKVLSIYAEQR